MPGRIIVAESIASTVRFVCPDDRSAAMLAFVEARPAMPDEDRPVRDVQLVEFGDGFYDFEPTSPGTADHMVERASVEMRLRLVEETRSAAVLHGGCLVVDGRRFVVMATKGSGKTTLMLGSMARGIAVEGDEHVVVWQSEVMARPRTLRIKAGTVPLVPELADEVLVCPFRKDWYGTPIYSFAPRSADGSWTIGRGKADILLFLEPNHGGLSGIKRIDQDTAFRRLLDNAYLPGERKGVVLANLHRLSRTTQSWEMRIGDLDGAVRFLHLLAQL